MKSSTPARSVKYGFLSLTLAALACSDPSGPSTLPALTAPGTPSLDKISQSAPLDVFVTNPCNGEFVLVTGESETVVWTSAKANGKTDVRTSQRDRGTGVAYPSGTIYTYDWKSGGSFSSADPFPIHITTYDNLKLNAKGVDHSNDFTSTIKTVTHINSRGTITQDRTVEKSSCS